MEDRETFLPPHSDREKVGVQGYQEYLQDRLKLHAEARVRGVLNSALDQVQNYSPSLIPAKADGVMRDSAFSLQSLYDLGRADLLTSVASVGIGETETITAPQAVLIVQRLSPTNFGLNFIKAENLAAMRASISDGIKTSPVSRTLGEAVLRYTESGKDKELTSGSFRIQDDPLTSAVVLESLNLFGRPRPLIRYDSSISPMEIAEGLLTKAFVQKATRDEEGKIASVRLQLDEGVEIILEAVGEPPHESDVLMANWAMRLLADPTPYMMETANQSPGSKCEVFINRATGREFIRALEKSGLRFSANFEDFLITGRSAAFDDRYGGAYSQISRILAKIIHSGDITGLNDVFVSASGNQISSQQLEKLVQFESHDKGVQAFQDILRQILSIGNKTSSDPSVTSSKISITAGACFDVVSYYAQAQELGKLYNVELFGRSFLGKTHGARTFINTEEFPFNGIILPKGSLFVKGEDGGLAFLRLTPFMFDSRDDMVSAFGTEIIKAERNEGNIAAVVERIKYA